VVAAGTAYANGLFDPATEVAGQSSAVADAQAAVVDSAALRTDLAAEVKDAKAVLKSPDGRASEQEPRAALNAVIEDAQDLVTSLGSVTRSPSGTEQQADTVLDLTAALRAEIPAVTNALRDASRAVVALGRQVRGERAVSELEAARTGLRAAATAGEPVYAESATDTEGRDALRAALDSAGDLDAQATELLATLPERAAVEVLGQAGKLATAMAATEAQIEDVVAAVLAEAPGGIAVEADGADADPASDPTATEGGKTAAKPAGTCPEPDQVWSAENGHLWSSELAQIPWARRDNV
jgi:hypothetical protein